MEPGKAFSKKVVYVYTKQLEEAEQIVINKIDLLSPERMARLRAVLSERFPKARVLEASARYGTGLDAWFEAMARENLGREPAMEVDYEMYAEGEALLGWLNCTVNVMSAVAVNGNELLAELSRDIQGRLAAAGAEIAHLKMTLTPGDEVGDIAVLNVARSDGTAELSHRLQGPIESGELIVNLRAEADPELLRQALLATLAAREHNGIMMAIEHLEHFRPGKPQPTHRLSEA
jgi:hypothetical protein